MKQCKHPTCGDTCRREKKQKRVYRIPKMSKKREKLHKEQYLPKVREILAARTKCEISSPVCITVAQGWNHPAGKHSTERLLDFEHGQVACNPCNTYCEEHPTWAMEHGFISKRNTAIIRSPYKASDNE